MSIAHSFRYVQHIPEDYHGGSATLGQGGTITVTFQARASDPYPAGVFAWCATVSLAWH